MNLLRFTKKMLIRKEKKYTRKEVFYFQVLETLESSRLNKVLKIRDFYGPPLGVVSALVRSFVAIVTRRGGARSVEAQEATTVKMANRSNTYIQVFQQVFKATLQFLNHLYVRGSLKTKVIHEIVDNLYKFYISVSHHH
jgi:hypothetical protein